MTTIRQTLPALYGRMLAPILDELSMPERLATCDDCAMCRPEAPSGVLQFRPDTKCCTYHPKLPCYLVGALLDDTDPALDEGRLRVRQKIGARIGITPQWVAPPKKFNVLLQASRNNSFGRSASLLCPFYEKSDGNCTIWKFRESDCSTFFCKYEEAADGQSFWRAMGAYLVLVERGLSAWAARQVDPSTREPPARRDMTVEELEDRPPSDATYRSYWRAYVGREEEFYRACAAAVSDLDHDRLVEIVGADAHAERLSAVKSSFEQAKDGHVPEQLVLAPDLRRVSRQGPREHVVSYSRYHPAVLSSALLDALTAFDGERSTTEALRAVADAGVELEESELEGLLHQRILGPPEQK